MMVPIRESDELEAVLQEALPNEVHPLAAQLASLLHEAAQAAERGKNSMLQAPPELLPAFEALLGRQLTAGSTLLEVKQVGQGGVTLGVGHNIGQIEKIIGGHEIGRDQINKIKILFTAAAPGQPPAQHWLWLRVAVVVVLPLVIGLSYWLTQNPWASLVWGALYVLVVALAIALPWLYELALRLRSLGYRRRYLRYLLEEHRFLNSKDLRVQGPYDLLIEQVVVDLQLSPQTAHKAGTGLVPMLVAAQPQQATPLASFLAAPQLRRYGLAILGAPGSGKTTLLRTLALKLARRARWPGFRRQLPIFLLLSDHADSIEHNPQYTLAQAVYESLQRQQGPLPPPGWVERQLRQGRCIILLDGLDEVADDQTRQKVAAWVEQLLRLQHANRLLLTSRPLGYRANPLGGMAVLEACPFSQQQIERFVQNWYLASAKVSSGHHDAGIARQARRDADDLLQRLRAAPNLATLASNPLLLTMIANVHRYRSSLPGKRIELYADVCKVFLGKRRQELAAELELRPAQKQSVLEPLAYGMMQQRRHSLTLDEATPLLRDALARVNPQLDVATFLKQLEASSGLILEYEAGVYGFAHHTFQEYLAAVHCREQHLEHELLACIDDSWWHETLRLYAAQADATALVGAVLADGQPSVEALLLAIDCTEEALSMTREMRDRLSALIDSGLEDVDLAQRVLVAEVLLSLRLRRLVGLDDERAIDRKLLSNAEYQLFLDEQAPSLAHQPDHWPGSRFPAGQATAPVLGLRPSDVQAFCTWLTARTDQPVRYRLPGQHEIALFEHTLQSEAWHAEHGVWVLQNQQPLCLSPRPDALLSESEAALTHCYQRDLAALLLELLARIVSPGQLKEQTQALALSCELALSQAPQLDHAPVPAFMRALAFDRARVRLALPNTADDSRALAADLARALGLNLPASMALLHTQPGDLAAIIAPRGSDALVLPLVRALLLSFELAHAAAASGLELWQAALDLARSHAQTISAQAALVAPRASADLTIPRDISQELLATLQTLPQGLNPEQLLTAAQRLEAREAEAPGERSLAEQLAAALQRDGTLDAVARAEQRHHIRLRLLRRAFTLGRQLEDQPWLTRVVGGAEQSQAQQLYRNVLGLYSRLALLEQRINGELAPYEGLLLVRQNML